MHPDPLTFFRYRIACLEAYFQHPLVLGIYDVAAWLRQLLLDPTPLITVANRDLRLQIRFVVNTLPREVQESLGREPMIIHFGAGLSPALTRLSTQPRELSLDSFLKEPILLANDETISVRQLILWAAQEAGGVHFDPKPDGTTLVLNRLMRAVDSEDNPVLASTIIGIARIVVDACTPLVAAITAREA